MNSVFSKILGKFLQIKAIILTPRFKPIVEDKAFGIEGLGSIYGRKFLSTTVLNKNPLLVSGGVGEDVSFDIEFLNKFKGTCILFDPTPRAEKHFNEIQESLGGSRTRDYSFTGTQSVKSYDLRSINSDNFIYYKLALLDSAGTVRFFEPPVKEHVSYSIQNIQNRFKTTGSYIEVEAIGAAEVGLLLPNRPIDILKLDIEGSELIFLKSCFRSGLLPNQILVEIDELHFPSIRSRRIAIKLLRLIESYNYIMVYRDGFNFTFLHEHILQED